MLQSQVWPQTDCASILQEMCWTVQEGTPKYILDFNPLTIFRVPLDWKIFCWDAWQDDFLLLWDQSLSIVMFHLEGDNILIATDDNALWH